jgi:hypothetical protein
LLPVTVALSPVSPETVAGFGVAVQLDARKRLTGNWWLYATAGLTRIGLDFQGGGDHVDTVSDPNEELSYDRAKQTDQLVDLSLGLERQL